MTPVFFRSCRRVFSIIILTVFSLTTISTPYARAQMNLPTPGTLVMPSTPHQPAVVCGLTVDPKDPLQLSFLVDQGEDQFNETDLKTETLRMVNYFLASLALPEKDLWVNLSPYEKDRMINEKLGKTEMGRDLLELDYMLKQLTSSLMYPDEKLGKEFWSRIYSQAAEKFGTTEIPMDTFHKVWIVPAKAVVFSKGTTGFILESKLKVMLDSDYLLMQTERRGGSVTLPEVTGDPSPTGGLQTRPYESEKTTQELSNQIMREVLIPAIEKEINEGANFAQLRQIYNANILATWFKKNLRESLLGKVYSDKGKTSGIDVNNEQRNQEIYSQYVEAFNKGVFNLIREETDPITRQELPRKYFSGGTVLSTSEVAQFVPRANRAQLAGREKRTKAVAIRLADAAMRSDRIIISTDFFKMGRLQVENYLNEKGFRLAPVDSNDVPEDALVKFDKETVIKSVKALRGEDLILFSARSRGRHEQTGDFGKIVIAIDKDELENTFLFEMNALADEVESFDAFIQKLSDIGVTLEKVNAGKPGQFFVSMDVSDRNMSFTGWNVMEENDPLLNGVSGYNLYTLIVENKASDLVKTIFGPSESVVIEIPSTVSFRQTKTVLPRTWFDEYRELSAMLRALDTRIVSDGKTEGTARVIRFESGEEIVTKDASREIVFSKDGKTFQAPVDHLPFTMSQPMILQAMRESLSKRMEKVQNDMAMKSAVLPRVNPTETESWKVLKALAATKDQLDLREMFKADPVRDEKYRFGLNEEFYVDFSKQLITDEILNSLMKLAREVGLPEAVKKMMAGEKINETENRAVFHMALRNVKRDPQTGKLVAARGPMLVEGQDVMPDVIAVLEHMESFIAKLHSGEWRGATGKKIKSVVNIGIGGSDLGPKMGVEALRPFKYGEIDAFFVSNIDGTAAAELMKKLDPEETLVIIASKTFTTDETITNANTFKKWVLDHYQGNQEVIKKHFVAVSTNAELVSKFGIDTANMFGFWDWVGGRFSMWSAVGLSLAAYIGFDNFLEFLQGTFEADENFLNQPFESNIAVIKALMTMWNGNFLGARTEAILPYDQYMAMVPAYEQQAQMESNGKKADRNGNLVDYPTGLITWGAPGTDGQHSFHNLMHQGTDLVPADFIGVIQSHNELPGHHGKFFANFIAQTEALAFGARTDEIKAILEADPKYKGEDVSWLAVQKTLPGNKPTTSILMDKVTPRTLGNLIGIYDNEIFVKGIIWNLFSFDQWGVELGKKIAVNNVIPFIDGTRSMDELEVSGLSSSAQWTLKRFVEQRKNLQLDAAMSVSQIENIDQWAADKKRPPVVKEQMIPDTLARVAILSFGDEMVAKVAYSNLAFRYLSLGKVPKGGVDAVLARVADVAKAALSLVKIDKGKKDEIAQKAVNVMANAVIKFYDPAMALEAQAAQGRDLDNAQDQSPLRGGIDLADSGSVYLESGALDQFHLDPAMVTRFRNGEFRGFSAEVIGVKPVENLPKMLGI